MRRAFIMGSNGPADISPLRFAISDAHKMAETLGGPRCGFEVVTPEPGMTTWEVQERLTSVAEGCSADDTFVCYFAGHGLSDKGILFLLWDHSRTDRLLSTAIPVANVMQAMNVCRAENKLLILDCCKAGAAFGVSGFRDVPDAIEEVGVKPDNHLVLAASGRLEKAREIEALGGGFLTVNICTGLNEYFHDVDANGDSRVSISELHRWLERIARVHNQAFPELFVPPPYLFGQRRGEFFLTRDDAQWVPFEIPWPDGSTMVVLPLRPVGDRAFCIGKYPVTNQQYRAFVDHSLIVGLKEFPYLGPYQDVYGDEWGACAAPIGKKWFRVGKIGASGVLEHWQGPFAPWGDKAFNKPNQPVVCVSFHDAMDYCRWVRMCFDDDELTKTYLPYDNVWGFAAFGVDYTPRKPSAWISATKAIHTKAKSPAPLDGSGDRTNKYGVSDMIGNVWEWCFDVEVARKEVTRKIQYFGTPPPKELLRGGGFLDDLNKVRPFLSAAELPEGSHTRHADIGFRVSATIKVCLLPEDVVQRLALCQNTIEFPELQGELLPIPHTGAPDR